MRLHARLGLIAHHNGLCSASSIWVVNVLSWFHRWKGAFDSLCLLFCTWLCNRGHSFSPHSIGTINFTFVIVMHNSYKDWMHLMIVLKLQILFSSVNIFFSEVFHLLYVLLFEYVHLPLQGNDQSMNTRHLARKVHHRCKTPISKGPHDRGSKYGERLPLWWFFWLDY